MKTDNNLFDNEKSIQPLIRVITYFIMFTPNQTSTKIFRKMFFFFFIN